MIRIDNLVKNYGDFQALKSVSFDIHDGEILGFLGANGAGKSTTLKIMTGYLAPTAGNVLVDGQNVVDDSFEIREQIGYLPETNPLYIEMKVFDYLQFIAKVRGLEGKVFHQGFARVVEQCGLSEVIHKPIATCSKGFKQRIGLAAAMIHDPKILILDEPVSGLDPNQIVEIRELIKDLGREKLVIMSSHILQEIAATVDRIVIIDNGKIVANGTTQELMSSFQGKTQLTLEISQASAESVESLSTGVTGLEIKNTRAEVDGNHVLSIEYDRDSDPRADIFNYAKSSGWVILEMSPYRVQLEDVFRDLTVEGGGHA